LQLHFRKTPLASTTKKTTGIARNFEWEGLKMKKSVTLVW